MNDMNRPAFFFLILFLSLWKGEWKTIHSLRKKKVYEWIVFPSPFPPYHLVHSALSADTKGMIVVSDRSEPREWMGMRPLSPHNLILFSAVSQGVKEVSSHSIHSQSIRFAAFGASLLCKNIIIYLYYSCRNLSLGWGNTIIIWGKRFQVNYNHILTISSSYHHPSATSTGFLHSRSWSRLGLTSVASRARPAARSGRRRGKDTEPTGDHGTQSLDPTKTRTKPGNWLLPSIPHPPNRSVSDVGASWTGSGGSTKVVPS